MSRLQVGVVRHADVASAIGRSLGVTVEARWECIVPAAEQREV